jgi:hypothetical protein
MAIFDQENKNLTSSRKFFSILIHQNIDPDPQLEKMMDALNQCGSETLPVTHHKNHNIRHFFFIVVDSDPKTSEFVIPDPRFLLLYSLANLSSLLMVQTRIRGSVSLINGSGFGSCYFRPWPSGRL